VKALVKSRKEPGLWLEEVEAPKIGINDVLIRVDRTGICGTDLHIYRWDDYDRGILIVEQGIYQDNQRMQSYPSIVAITIRNK